MAERTFIDPKEFATNFASAIMSGERFNEKTIVEDSKKYLISYLTSYYLVEDFNKMENKNFKDASTGKDVKFKDMTFAQLLERVKELNKY